MNFKHGKYEGQTFKSILNSDPDYIEYLYFDLNGGQEPAFKRWVERELARLCFADSEHEGQTLEYVLEVDPAFICHMYDTVNDLNPLFVKWFDSRGTEIRKASRTIARDEWNEYDKIKKEIGGL